MPRFFFHVHDGRDIPDHVGEELVDWGEARKFAIKYAGRLLDNEAGMLALGEDWWMDVCDERELVLFRLDFHVSLAPVLSGKDSYRGDGKKL